jgi:hypothetical protein
MSFIFSAPKPPPAPDYAGAAREQGAANIETARLEGRMNRPDVFSPYDVTTVTELPDDRFRQDYTLRPEYEAQRVKQVGIADKYLDIAGDYLGGIPTEEFSLANLSTQPGLINRSGFATIPTIEDLEGYATRVEGDYYNRGLARIKPIHDQQIVSLRTELLNAGIPEGSVAYNNAMEQLRRTHEDTLLDLTSQSIREGQALADAQLRRTTGIRSFQTSDALSEVAERERMRDRQLSDYLLGRTQPLSEVATLAGQAPPPPAIATTGLNVPATSIAPPPLFAATQAQGLDATQRYGSAVDAYSGRMAGLGSILGGAAGSGAFARGGTFGKA